MLLQGCGEHSVSTQTCIIFVGGDERHHPMVAYTGKSKHAQTQTKVRVYRHLLQRKC
jgi:hypothetical protein